MLFNSLPEVHDPQFDERLKLWQARRESWEFALKAFTTCLLIVSAALAVIQYLSQRKELIRQNEEAQQQRIKDFNSIVYRTRFDVYLEATDTLSRFVYASDRKEADEAEQRFWELYDGKFSVIEDEQVKEEIILVGKFLMEWEDCKTIPVPFLFQNLAYDFTQSCRQSLKTVFPEELNPLSAGQAKHPAHIIQPMLKCVCQPELVECKKPPMQ
jgi:hypothetical protein